MNLNVSSELIDQLDNAYEVVDTVVLRTTGGAVFTIEMGISLIDGAASHGARTSLAAPQSRHLGTCEGDSQADVFAQAQQQIAATLRQGIPTEAMPRPHIAPGTEIEV